MTNMKNLSGPSMRVFYTILLMLLILWNVWFVHLIKISETVEYWLYLFGVFPKVHWIWFVGLYIGMFLNLLFDFLFSMKRIKKILKNKVKPSGKAIEAKIPIKLEEKFFFEEVVDLFEGDADFFTRGKSQVYLVIGAKKIIYRHLARLSVMTFILVMVGSFFFQPSIQNNIEIGESISIADSSIMLKEINLANGYLELASGQEKIVHKIGKPLFLESKVIHFNKSSIKDSLEAKIQIINPKDNYRIISRLKINETQRIDPIKIQILKIDLEKRMVLLHFAQKKWAKNIWLHQNQVKNIIGSRFSFVLEQIRPVVVLKVNQISVWPWIFMVVTGLLAMFFYIQSWGAWMRVLILWEENQISVYGFLENLALDRWEFEKFINEMKDSLEYFDCDDFSIKYRYAKVS